jgi:hypothetical protein
MRQFWLIWTSQRATFVLEFERFTAKNRQRESWRNHDIVDGESGHGQGLPSTAECGGVLQFCAG